ncbi:hypothetical protein X927_07445 [Petrotoga mexicana DSM 14811]|uniref:PhoU domain-containing protein n=1 Tax=Petrotoga mexicana DSM 14811 TaxID=1122954 RepID=A0A2K1P7S4_9BACT|nr:PhoU domain-containing protein [Petrotoga mexicana]PNR98833.1 hypothetical protein X927_07445 [Petrotoga mexicana DSM 14811]
MFKKENVSQINSISLNRLTRYLNNVLRMGRIVQEMYYKFGDTYLERNDKLAKEIINQDDRLDFIEASLNYESVILLSSGNYTGIYLKACFMSSKLVQIFENMGDICEKNAKLMIEILKTPSTVNAINFEDSLELTKENLSIVLSSLSDLINIKAAKLMTDQVKESFFEKAKKSCILNEEVKGLIDAYKSYLYKSKESIKSASLHIEVLNNLANFSDLITNISENIIWALTGELYKCRNNDLELFYFLGEENS